MNHLLDDGWFPISGVSGEYRINRYGKILNIATGRIHPVHYNANGYYQATLKDEWGYPAVKSIHRLVAIAFVDVPSHLSHWPPKDLHVRHCDGNKTNNDAGNLRWCTPLEWTFFNRINNDYQNELAVVAKNVNTKERLSFKSISAAAKHANVSQSSLNKHLHSESAGRIQEGGWIYKLRNGRPWPSVVFPERDHLRLTRVADVIVKQENNPTIYVFNSVTEAARLLELNLVGLKNHFSRQGFDKPFHGYQFYTVSEYFRKR